MNITKEKIQKVTSRGQITLPVDWRRKTNTDIITLRTKGNLIEISPLQSEHGKNSEYTVFDAIIDNKGKGIKAVDLLKILNKIDR